MVSPLIISLSIRKLEIIESMSWDAVIQAPGSRNEDGDSPYGRWTVP
jgi:hypothetical protein